MTSKEWHKQLDREGLCGQLDHVDCRSVIHDYAACEAERDECKAKDESSREALHHEMVRAEKAEAARDEWFGRYMEAMKLAGKLKAERDEWHKAFDKACDDVGRKNAENADLSLRLEQMRVVVHNYWHRGHDGDCDITDGVCYLCKSMSERNDKDLCAALSTPPGELAREVEWLLSEVQVAGHNNPDEWWVRRYALRAKMGGEDV